MKNIFKILMINLILLVFIYSVATVQCFATEGNAVDGSFVVEEDMNIQDLNLSCNLYIAKGTTLTLTGTAQINGSVYVFGTLDNGAELTISGTLYCLNYGSLFSAGDYDFGYFINNGKAKIGSMLVEETYLDTAIPHVHKWDNGSIGQAPTCTQNGVLLISCTTCEQTKKESISATGHKEAIRTAMEATCTKEGLTEGKECSECGAVLSTQTKVPAKGHSYKDGICEICGMKDSENVIAPENLCDVDGDNNIAAADARLALRASVGLEEYAPDSDSYKAADVDGNGKIEAADARIILRLSVGLEEIEAIKESYAI